MLRWSVSEKRTFWHGKLNHSARLPVLQNASRHGTLNHCVMLKLNHSARLPVLQTGMPHFSRLR